MMLEGRHKAPATSNRTSTTARSPARLANRSTTTAETAASAPAAAVRDGVMADDAAGVDPPDMSGIDPTV